MGAPATHALVNALGTCFARSCQRASIREIEGKAGARPIYRSVEANESLWPAWTQLPQPAWVLGLVGFAAALFAFAFPCTFGLWRRRLLA